MCFLFSIILTLCKETFSVSQDYQDTLTPDNQLIILSAFFHGKKAVSSLRHEESLFKKNLYIYMRTKKTNTAERFGTWRLIQSPWLLMVSWWHTISLKQFHCIDTKLYTSDPKGHISLTAFPLRTLYLCRNCCGIWWGRGRGALKMKLMFKQGSSCQEQLPGGYFTEETRGKRDFYWWKSHFIKRDYVSCYSSVSWN